MAKDDYFSHMGLTFTEDKHLCWGMDHGFGRYWLPEWFKRLILNIWNPFRCWQRGHDMFMVELVEHGYVRKADARCCACCADLKRHVRWIRPAPDSAFEAVDVT